jgi:tubulin-folding cofactor B
LIPDIQNKLELITGIPVSNQALSLYNSEEDAQPAATLEDDSRPLGYYSARDWQFLKVHSHLSMHAAFTDLTNI